MTDQDYIDQTAEVFRNGDNITDLQARIVAAQWHGGQTSALYSLASCGAISEDAGGEVAAELRHSDASQNDLDALDALSEYVRRCGVRGPVDGWADLHW